jgi:hypothetical protein
VVALEPPPGSFWSPLRATAPPLISCAAPPRPAPLTQRLCFLPRDRRELLTTTRRAARAPAGTCSACHRHYQHRYRNNVGKSQPIQSSDHDNSPSASVSPRTQVNLSQAVVLIVTTMTRRWYSMSLQTPSPNSSKNLASKDASVPE